ncbi:MAG: NAD-dependent epimerase/dehydratase family protein [Candidatus Hermodarchaeota archaeon]
MEIDGNIIFITGGAGFIGSHLVDRFIEENAKKVIVYDNFSTGKKENIKKKGVDIIEGDILDYKKLEKTMKDVDIVSHHAAELEVFTGIENSLHDLRTNIEGTLNVLNAAIKNKVKKLIYASSGGVYGQANYLPEDENHPLMPHWPYGVSKLSGEKYCTQYYLLHGLPTVSLRYGIVYGPREWYGRVLTLFIKRVLEGNAPIIFGDGNQRRDYVYIDDVVEGNILTIKSEKSEGKVFNLGGNNSYSVKEVADIVIDLINPDISPIYDDPIPGESSKFQPNRKRLPGELKDFVLDSSLISNLLSYIPKTDFKFGVEKEIDWVKENLDIWNTLPRV